MLFEFGHPRAGRFPGNRGWHARPLRVVALLGAVASIAFPTPASAARSGSATRTDTGANVRVAYDRRAAGHPENPRRRTTARPQPRPRAGKVVGITLVPRGSASVGPTSGSRRPPTLLPPSAAPKSPHRWASLVRLGMSCSGHGAVLCTLSTGSFKVGRRPAPVPRRTPTGATAPLHEAGSAEETLVLPSPVIGMSPPVDWEQVVNLTTWLWVEPASWGNRSKRAQAGDEWAEVEGRPRAVRWDMGNGDVVTCPGPGSRYDPARPAAAQSTDCSYTYRRSSAQRPGDIYVVTATSIWDLSWSGSAGGGELGSVERSAQVEIRVAELEALTQ